MNLETLLADLAANNISVWHEGDRLLVSAPSGDLPESLRTSLRAHKQALLEVLRSGQSLTHGTGGDDIAVPPNRLKIEQTSIAPDMLPLIALNQGDIDRIVAQVPGGVNNIRDIYALSPLQEGILFHHLLSSVSDPYLVISEIAFAGRDVLDRFLAAAQQVVDRHDILRTAFIWEGLSEPAQIVLRNAPLSVIEIPVDEEPGTASEQLARRFDPRHTRIDLSQPPLLRLVIAKEPDSQRWMMICVQHHMIGDNTTVQLLQEEIAAFVTGRGDSLPPSRPFRNLIAEARLGGREARHEAFFSKMLGDVDEPTLPFGLNNVHLDGQGVSESRRRLPRPLIDNLRQHARRLGVSLASLCHVAFGLVLARCSNRETVVFGTVLFGRLNGGEGVASAIGPYINTLPLRLDLDDITVELSVQQAHQRLAELLQHEYASLTVARACSGISPSTPLFSALLNYRHARADAGPGQLASLPAQLQGIEFLGGKAHNNYPFDLNIDDDGGDLALAFRVVDSLPSERMCDLMQVALERLEDALKHAPGMPVREIDVLSPGEHQLLRAWNDTESAYPADRCVHQLFEEKAALTPGAIAVVRDDSYLTYAQLNAQANRLAHRLIAVGVKPGVRVAVCADRYPHMVAGLLAILKAGAAYVPLDPSYPAMRLTEVLGESRPLLLLSDDAGRNALRNGVGDDMIHWALDEAIDAEADTTRETNPHPEEIGLTPSALAYVVYTSGSTGKPKGVAMPHRPLVNLIHWQNNATSHPSSQDRTLQFAALGFDVAFQEIACTLCAGGCLLLIDEPTRQDPAKLARYLRRERIERLFLPVVALQTLADTAVDSGLTFPELRHVSTSGAQLRITPAIQQLFSRLPHCRLHNQYGPAESHVVTEFTMPEAVETWQALPSIGRPIPNTRIYLLDRHGHPVPCGAVGEIYIGGVGIATGYLNRPDLTDERFVPDPFYPPSDSRMYRSGDLARYHPDGRLEVMGRADQQVKIRGFRVEPGEIEARLAKHPTVREAAVLAREDSPGEKRLVAYLSPQPGTVIDALALRAHLALELPDYMLPTAFVQLDTLPLTSNGKLDRRALPPPDDDSLARQAYEPPQGEIEGELAEIWSALLDAAHVGRHDRFFDLGGNSLLIIQLSTRMRERFGIDVPLARIIDAPTLADQAQVVLDLQIASFSTDDVDRISDEVANLSDEEIRAMFDSEADENGRTTA